MKRILWLRMKAPGGVHRQGEGFIRCKAERLEALKSYIPKEFLRKGRTLENGLVYLADDVAKFGALE